MELDTKETLRPNRPKSHYLRLAGGAAFIAVGLCVAAIYTAPDDSSDKPQPHPAESPIDQYGLN